MMTTTNHQEDDNIEASYVNQWGPAAQAQPVLVAAHGGVKASNAQGQSESSHRRPVHAQRNESRSAGGCHADDLLHISAPAEVLCPTVRARVEQRNFLVVQRIKCGLATSLVGVAGRTRQRKVVQRRLPAGRKRQDVLDLEHLRRIARR